MKSSNLSLVSPLLVDVAQGRKKANLLLKNGTLVDVCSGEILESIDVAIVGDRVAYVGSNGDHTVGAETTTLNLSKKYIIPSLLGKPLDFRRLTLASDSVDPPDLRRVGYIDHAVRKAVELGLDPIKAVQMATLNPAEHFGVDEDIGGVAPSKLADIVILSHLEKVRLETVICGGKVVCRGDEFLMEEDYTPHPYPPFALRTMRVKALLKLSDLRIQVPQKNTRDGTVEVQVASIENETITRGKTLTVPVKAGTILFSEVEDLWKVAVIDRHHNSGQVGLGFAQGFKTKIGAIATSLNLDQNNLLVVGRGDSDMVTAANSVIGMGGGVTVAEKGAVRRSLRMELAGMMATGRFQEVAEGVGKIEDLLRERGSPFKKPLNPILFLTFVTLPEIRFTERGMVDVKSRRFCSIFPSTEQN